jgi:hypothetical protein
MGPLFQVPLQIFKVIPSSLMAILVAILLEFAVVRNCGSRTDTIGDVSESWMMDLDIS